MASPRSVHQDTVSKFARKYSQLNTAIQPASLIIREEQEEDAVADSPGPYQQTLDQFTLPEEPHRSRDGSGSFDNEDAQTMISHGSGSLLSPQPSVEPPISAQNNSQLQP